MAYTELIKNFEKVRAYMRDFYVYGFKSRTEYDRKSARSYDDERRRIEGWLGDYMRFTQTPEGKSVFLSIDSRTVRQSPLNRAWKAKSFTDRDITLHFLLLDVLWAPEVSLPLTEILAGVDARLAQSRCPMTFDESTVRKKLDEYIRLGLLKKEKRGNVNFYARLPSPDLTHLRPVLDFFTEAAPCGVAGSYLLDRLPREKRIFSFKHHYITQTLDADILACLLDAMSEHRFVTAQLLCRREPKPVTVRFLPLRVCISTQTGRQNLIAWNEQRNRLATYRIDKLSDIRLQEVCSRFEELRRSLGRSEAHMWGVNCRWSLRQTERVEFDIRIGPDEGHILKRLEREKRCGTVTPLDENHYRFTAHVFDTAEMLPWIRTYLCRITRLNFSNRTAENLFKADLRELYEMYGLEGTP